MFGKFGEKLPAVEQESHPDIMVENLEILSNTTVDFRLPEHEGRELKPSQK